MNCTGACTAPQQNDNWTYLSNTPHIETGNTKDDFVSNSFFRISGIAISDKNPNTLWICYESYYPDNVPYKVYKSIDGGNSWAADETGLPDYSFKKIIYKK